VRLAALALGILLFAYMTVMLALMWIAGGHVPLSNGAETMMAIAWTVLLAGLLVGRRFTLMQPFALIVASLALLVAAMGQANPSVTLLVPVLSSPLLSIHVSLMMLSYAILAVIMVNSAAGLVVSGISRGSESVGRLADVSSLMLYFGLFFLAAGIITGSVWANVSWGCYWNWDPKETWALITLLIYAVPAHRSNFKFLRKPTAYNIYLLLAFISVLFTYFGVNFLLGGLHSYAG
jgi:ABC-type transport system involved in cytochrome c biogenesis permease subunit